MVKNIMYLSVTAFMLFKLCDGIDWYRLEARAVRTYRGAAAGFAEGEPRTGPANKLTAAILPAANVVVPLAADVAKAPAADEEVAGCRENCEGDDSEEALSADAAPLAVQAKAADSPTVVRLPQTSETPAVVTNGQ